MRLVQNYQLPLPHWKYPNQAELWCIRLTTSSYARCCQELEDFRSRTSVLIDRLVRQHFTISLLKKTFEKFAESYYELLAKYGVHASTTCVFK